MFLEFLGVDEGEDIFHELLHEAMHPGRLTTA
jgi:hypothetical protein